MTSAAETTIVTRGLAEMADTADKIADEVSIAGCALLDAYRGDRDEPQAIAGALALLHSAREGIDALIREVRQEAGR